MEKQFHILEKLWCEVGNVEDLAQEARVQAEIRREKALATWEKYKVNKYKIDKTIADIDNMLENLKLFQKNLDTWKKMTTLTEDKVKSAERAA